MTIKQEFKLSLYRVLDGNSQVEGALHHLPVVAQSRSVSIMAVKTMGRVLL